MTDAELMDANAAALCMELNGSDNSAKLCRRLIDEITTLRAELSQALATVKFYADGRERQEAREAEGKYICAGCVRPTDTVGPFMLCPRCSENRDAALEVF